MRARLSSTVAALGLCAFAGPAGALSVNASNVTVTTGGDVTISVSATPDQATYKHSWSIEKVGFLPNLSSCATSSTSYQEVPAGMRIASSNLLGTSATISWPAEDNRYGAGVHCIRIEVCEYGTARGATCTSTSPKAYDVIKVTAQRTGLAYNRPQSYVYRAGDSYALTESLPYFGQTISPTSTASDLLELVSCPSGASCSPPALPSWVTTELDGESSTGNSGLSFAWQPPAGTTEGDWVFRTVPVAQSVEVEDNDSIFHPDRVIPGTSTRGSVSPIGDVDNFVFRGSAGDVVTISATAGFVLSGCSADVLLTLRRYNGGTSFTTLTSDATNSGTVCARISSYTLPTDADYVVSVQENGNNATVGYYGLSVSGASWVEDVPSAGTDYEELTFRVVSVSTPIFLRNAPAWNTDEELAGGSEYFNTALFHYSDGAGDEPHRKKYGSCDAAIGAYLDDITVRADYFGAFADATTSSSCGVADTSEREDDFGMCRSATAGLADEEYGPDVTLVETPEGTLFGYFPDTYTESIISTVDGGDIIGMNLVAYQGARAHSTAAAHRVYDGSTTRDTILQVNPEWGGNDIHYEPWGHCASYALSSSCISDYPRFTRGGDVSLPTTGCVMGNAFSEGDTVRMPLRRYNQRLSSSAISLQRCSSTSDTTCSLSTLGATYSAGADELRWEIPYTATTGTSRFYFRVFLNGTETSPYYESDAYYWVVLDVNNRDPFSGSGPDLYVRDFRERFPQAYVGVEPKLIDDAIGRRNYSSAEQAEWDEQSRWYLTNQTVSRVFAPGDTIPVHPSFEDDSKGAGKGSTRFFVSVYNRGTATGGDTWVDAYLRPVSVDVSGGYQSSPPDDDDAPVDSQHLGTIGAGDDDTYTLSLQADDLLLYWSASNVHEGTPRALYLVIRSSKTYAEPASAEANNVLGPFFFVPPPPPPETTFRSESIDLYGSFLSASDDTPTSGTALSAYVLVKNRRYHSNLDSEVRFYLDRETAPDASTSAYASEPLPASIPANSTTAFTFRVEGADLQKPDRSDNTLYLRAFIDPANTVNEAYETNNQLPSTAAAYAVQIENTPPAFAEAPTGVELTATEGQEWRYTLKLAEIDEVDQSRLALTLLTSPTVSGGDDGVMTLEGALSSCGADFFCQDLVWTPGDQQASSPTHAVSVRVCDGDPVAVAAGNPQGDCDQLDFTLSLSRVNDAPAFTSAPAAEATLSAEEDAAWSFDLDAVDEEDGASLVYSLVSPPTGMTIDASTGLVAWTPGDAFAGRTATVRVSVRDQGTGGSVRTTTRRFYLAVANVNDPPVLGAPDDTTAVEDELWVVRLPLTDADVDVSLLTQTLTCSLGAAVTPDWVDTVTLVTDGGVRYCQASGTPDNADTGTPSVRVRASDGVDTIGRTFTVTVADAPASPTFVTAPGLQSATQGSQWSLVVTAADEDFDSPAASESLTWSRVSGPAASITPATDTKSASLAWTPGASDANTSPTLVVRVTDASGRSAELSISFGTIANVNDAPYLTQVPGPITLAEGDAFLSSHRVLAGDPDKDAGYAETVRFSIVSALDAATGAVSLPDLVIDPVSGQLGFATPDGRPDDAQVGAWTVVVRASDDETPTPAYDEDSLSLTITNVNDAPALDPIGDQAVSEGQLLSFVVSAFDEDGTTPALSASDLPAGASFTDHGDGSGTFSWTPTLEQSGGHLVTFSCSDGALDDEEILTISVGDVPRPPVLAAIGPQAVDEDDDLVLLLSATDPDGTVPSFGIANKPATASFTDHGNGTATFAWTPGAADVGIHDVTFSASDGALADQEIVRVTVNDINYPPAWSASAPTGTVAGAEGSALTFTLDATDVDGPAALSYGAVGLPLGASYDESTGAFRWTPDYDQAGTREVDFEASDGAVTISRTLTLEIANTDRAPVISGPTSVTVIEAQTVSFSLSASDPDGDGTTLSLLDDDGTGASFAAGQLTWVTGYDDAGSYTLRFRAQAGALSDEHDVVVTVNDQNRAPVVTSTPPTTATEDQPYSYTLTGSDPDGDDFTLGFVSGPAGASLDTSTGLLTWTPTGAQVGNRSFQVQLSDGKVGGVTTHAWTVAVAAYNDPPVIGSSPVVTATEDSGYAYQASASDEEGATLTWTLASAPAGMSVSPSGLVSWLPRNADVGEHDVTLEVRDPGGALDTQTFTVTVANTNDAPTITGDPPATVLEDAPWSWTPIVSDVDVGDTVTLALTSAPAGVTLVDGTLSWTPENDDVGVHSIRVTASDGAGASTPRTVSVEVLNRNDAPYFVSSPLDATVAEGATLNAFVEADDVDVGDTLRYSLVSAPARAQIDALTGALSFQPDDAEVGDHDFTVRVEDLAGAFVEQDAHVTVTPVNDPPVLAAIGARQVDFEATLTITLSATDPDGPSLTFRVEDAPPGSSLTSNVFTWTPGVTEAGAHDVTFVAGDGALEDSETITIVVGDGGPPPALTLPEDAVVDEGQTLVEAVLASDPAGGTDPITLAAEGLPSGATFVDDGGGSGTFSWTPGFSAAGNYAVVFSATNASGITRRTWNVTVRDVNRAPTITTLLLPPALEATPYATTVAASDPDGDTVTFSLPRGVGDLAIHASSGELSMTPTFGVVGEHTIEVRVSDGRGGVQTTPFTLLIEFLDEEDDGLPDTWELANGLDPETDDALLDPDGDGLSNLAEYQAGTDPFVSNAPATPVLLSPADGVRIDTATPTLTWQESTDPDGDPVRYAVVLVSLGSGAQVLAVSDVEASDGEGALAVDSPLTEGASYRWSVRASDGVGTSAPASRTFVVDAVNEPPPAPTLVSPLDDASLANASPALAVSPVLDPDGDAVSYRFRLLAAADQPPVVESEPIAAPATGAVRYTIPLVLEDGSEWLWEAEAVDARGLAGPAGGLWRFRVDLTNSPPPVPALIAPAEGERVTALPTTLRFGAVSDPEGEPVSYVVELAPNESFDLAEVERYTDLVSTDGSTVELLLAAGRADGAVYWRAYATDGVTFSDPLASWFEIDVVDEPPAAPTALAPPDASLVEETSVALVASATLDPEGEDAVSYRFELTDPDGVELLDSVDGVRDDDDGAEDLEVRATFDGLVPGERYGWRVLAMEDDGATSAPSTLLTFRVASENVRPDAPLLVSPAEGALVELPSVTLVFEAAVDPDGDEVLHDVELYLDDALLAAAGTLAADDDGNVRYTPAVPLSSGNARWRARGRDTGGAGQWAEGTFVVDLPDAGVEPGDDAGTIDDAGSGADAGEPAGEDGGVSTGDGGAPDDGGGVIPGRGDKEPPGAITTDLGYQPKRLSPSCACDSSDAAADGLALLVFGAALVGFTRRRRRS